MYPAAELARFAYNMNHILVVKGGEGKKKKIPTYDDFFANKVIRVVHDLTTAPPTDSFSWQNDVCSLFFTVYGLHFQS